MANINCHFLINDNNKINHKTKLEKTLHLRQVSGRITVSSKNPIFDVYWS